jgi:hypothetical protein
MRAPSQSLFLAAVLACTATPITPPKSDRVWTEVSAGRHVSCAIDDGGAIECWGDNSRHVPPDTGWVDLGEDVPPEEEGLIDVQLELKSYAAAGSGSACARRSDSSVLCWGAPIDLPPTETRLSALAVPVQSLCGIREDGSGACWADNSDDPEWIPASGLRAVRAAEDAVCFLDADGMGHCGYARDGEWEGSSRFAVREGPYSLVAPAGLDICGIDLVGNLECWNRFDETIAGRLTLPTYGAPFQDFCWSGGGLRWGCALNADKHLHCFGGFGDDPRWQWDVYPDDTPLVSISCGAFHVCGLTAEGAIHCYGDDTYDQLDVP